MDNNLRLILLVIGVCIVLGFYIWEILRKKKNDNKTDILKAVDEIPESPIHSNQVFTEEDYTKAITDLSELSNNLKDAQFSLDSNYSNASKNQVDNDLVSDNLLTKKDKIPSENLIIFYITSREGEVINGHSFYKIMNEVGMEYDEMKIFRLYKKLKHLLRFEVIKSLKNVSFRTCSFFVLKSRCPKQCNFEGFIIF